MEECLLEKSGFKIIVEMEMLAAIAKSTWMMAQAFVPSQ